MGVQGVSFSLFSCPASCLSPYVQWFTSRLGGAVTLVSYIPAVHTKQQHLPSALQDHFIHHPEANCYEISSGNSLAQI